VFFTHHTNNRYTTAGYIRAVWSADSSRCVLLYPQDRNVWLFRVRGRDIATERLDYGRISDRIEAALAAGRRRKPAVIERIEWSSAPELRLHITYDKLPVLVVVYVAKPNSPKIRVLRHDET
jgi:hypothetical protein